jgi:hypothetical protein
MCFYSTRTCTRTLRQKSLLCIPFLDCAASVPISTFMCLWAVYILSGSVHIFGCSKIDKPILEIYKCLTHTYVSAGTGRQNIIILFWKKRRLYSFISGNTVQKWEPDIYIRFSLALHLQLFGSARSISYRERFFSRMGDRRKRNHREWCTLFAKNCYLAPCAAASLADAPCRARALQNARQRMTPENWCNVS